MNPIKTIAGLALTASLGLPTSADAQRAGEITFFSQIGFRGQTFTVTGPRETVRIPFPIRSARLSRGDSWEVCTQTRFQGRCNVVSLRGMSAEFFPQPSDRSGRVISCGAGTTACAAESPDRFCQSRGWTASSYERQETVASRNFLADVLCTRTR